MLGIAKKLKAELIHKAKVKKEYAKVLKQEEQNTPEFYKKIFGEKTIDDEGNVVAYNSGQGQEDGSDMDEEEEDQDEEMNEGIKDENEDGDEEVDQLESEEDSEEQDDDGEEANNGKGSTKSRGAKESNDKQTKPSGKSGKQEDGTFKRAAKPNPFKAAIEKREAEKKAIQEAREKAQRERALAKKGRDAYYAKREKTTKKMREKTSRGQPVLSNQIKMMLGKIKQEVKGNTSRVPGQRGKGRPQKP
ncbi:hypothetical protein BX616_010193 [Lobosporangium transversale]|nr:hypothetical protein BX616_010193 [Lobosporangium transversale]